MNRNFRTNSIQLVGPRQQTNFQFPIGGTCASIAPEQRLACCANLPISEYAACVATIPKQYAPNNTFTPSVPDTQDTPVLPSIATEPEPNTMPTKNQWGLILGIVILTIGVTVLIGYLTNKYEK